MQHAGFVQRMGWIMFVGRGLLLALLLALQVTSALAQMPVFVFTAVPNRDEDELVRQFTPLADYIERKLGLKVKYVPADTYEATIKLFCNGKVSLAWFGGYSAIKARRQEPSAKIIAQGYEDASFKSYFIANTSTGLTMSKEFPRGMLGKTLLFGSRTSTSGRLVPEYWIREHTGKSSERMFSRVSFSGDHSSTWQFVQAGLAEIGVLDYAVFEAAKAAGKVDGNKVRVIWETPPFPDYAFVVRGDVDAIYGAGFTDRLRQAIVDIDDKAILSAFARSRFIPAKTEQYEFLEEVAAQIEADDKHKP